MPIGVDQGMLLAAQMLAMFIGGKRVEHIVIAQTKRPAGRASYAEGGPFGMGIPLRVVLPLVANI